MKLIGFLFRWLGFLFGLGALGLVGAALAGPFGWPFELFSSWPYLIAAIGLSGALILGLTGWPRFATGIVAGSLILIAFAVASPGDITRPTSSLAKSDVTTLIWGNVFSVPTNLGALTDQARSKEANIIVTGETPRNLSDAPTLLPATQTGAISVQGCDQTNVAFSNAIRFGQNTRQRTYAIKVACPEFTLFAVHLTNPLWQFGERQKRRGVELTDLARTIKAQKGAVVVIGDFNIAPNARPFSDFMKAANLDHSSCGGRWLPTWRPYNWRGKIDDRSPLTGIPIDHLFTRDVQVAACAVGKDFGSDHLPLIVQLKKPTPAKVQTVP